VNIVVWVVVIVVVAAEVVVARQRRSARTGQVADARAEARRCTERLGAQVYAIDAVGNAAARQALADAAERFTAAGSQVDQATSVTQFHLATQTAYEGLYYVRAARSALGLDPGPELPLLPGQQQAGQVAQARQVDVGGHDYQASPQPGAQTPHYYPGGYVAGRPVPGGWYSQPWWKPALVAGAWGVGTYLVASALFSEWTGWAGTTPTTTAAATTTAVEVATTAVAEVATTTAAGSTAVAGSTAAATTAAVSTTAVVVSSDPSTGRWCRPEPLQPWCWSRSAVRPATQSLLVGGDFSHAARRPCPGPGREPSDASNAVTTSVLTTGTMRLARVSVGAFGGTILERQYWVAA